LRQQRPSLVARVMFLETMIHRQKQLSAGKQKPF